MAKNTTDPAQEPEISTAPVQEAQINEADGAPIFHDPGEEGDGDE